MDCCFTNPVGVRRLLVLVQALPEGSATWRALRPEQGASSVTEAAGTTTVEYLADIAQSMRVQINQQIPQGKPKYKPPMPFRWPWPGVQVKPQTREDLRAALRR